MTDWINPEATQIVDLGSGLKLRLGAKGVGMKICVCVKQVPDSWAEKLTAADSTLDRAAADRVVNELDEYAVEEALRIVEAGEGEVTILSMGPDEAADSVRKAISMVLTQEFTLAIQRYTVLTHLQHHLYLPKHLKAVALI